MSASAHSGGDADDLYKAALQGDTYSNQSDECTEDSVRSTQRWLPLSARRRYRVVDGYLEVTRPGVGGACRIYRPIRASWQTASPVIGERTGVTDRNTPATPRAHLPTNANDGGETGRLQVQ